MPVLKQLAPLCLLYMKEPWDMVCQLKATEGEGYNNGKIDRHTYSVCSLTNPCSPGANEGVAAEVEEVNTCASESNEYGRESKGSRGTEYERQKRERAKAEHLRLTES